MLPDFPKIKHKLNQLSMQFVKKQINSTTAFGTGAKILNLHEGHKFSILRESGEVDESELKHITGAASINKDDIQQLSPSDLENKFNTIANQMSEQITANMLATVEKAVEKSGNILSSPDGLTMDWVLEATKKIPLQFINDDRRQPVLLTIYSSPETAKKYQEYLSNLSPTQIEEYEKKYQEILDVKYVEYMSELDSRKITD